MLDSLESYQNNRRSHPEVFCKKGALKKLAKFTGNTFVGVSFLIKLQVLQLATLLKTCNFERLTTLLKKELRSSANGWLGKT